LEIENKFLIDELPDHILNTYQMIRYAKMSHQIFTSGHKIDYHVFYKSIKQTTDKNICFRVHFSNEDENNFQVRTIGGSLIHAFLKYNQPCAFTIVYFSDDYQVLDISFARELLKIFLTDGKIISVLEQSLLLEIKTHTDVPKSFGGAIMPGRSTQQYLIHPVSYIENPIPIQENPPDTIDLWIALLEEKWVEFYRDVANKECTLDYYTQGNYLVRRKFTTGEPAIFTSLSDVNQLRELQAVSIIPNCHTTDVSIRPLTIEGIIDIDPSRFATHDERTFIYNTLLEFLQQTGLTFLTRLTGGFHKGFHIILPFKLIKPFETITNIASPQNYFSTLPVKIIINSVRESMVTLALSYLKECKTQGILDIATLEQDPYKVRLDLSRTSFKTGRRAIYSMHKGTKYVVIPLQPEEQLTTSQLQALQKLSQIDHCFAQADDLQEKIITPGQKIWNTKILEKLNAEHRELWKGYHMTPNKKKYLKTMLTYD
jgi:hypothetical protein